MKCENKMCAHYRDNKPRGCFAFYGQGIKRCHLRLAYEELQEQLAIKDKQIEIAIECLTGTGCFGTPVYVEVCINDCKKHWKDYLKQEAEQERKG